MQNSGFEKSVRRQMDELKIPPSAGLWDKIEPKLPAPRKQRRWLALLFLFALLSAGSWYTWHQLGVGTHSSAGEDKTERVQMPDQGGKQILNENASSIPGTVSMTESASQGEPTGEKNQLPASPLNSTQSKQKQPGFARVTSSSRNASHHKKSVLEKYPSKTFVKTFGPATENGDKTVDKLQAIVPTIGEPYTVTDTTSVIAITQDTTTKEISGPEKIVTTTTEIPGKPMPIVSTKLNKHWAYGIHLGAGISTVKNDLFSKSAIFADFPGNLSSGGPGSISPAPPENPTTAASFEAGLYLKKELNRHWAFTTGVNYAYLSNTMQTGVMVDSLARVSFSNQSLDALNVYRTGTSNTYRNQFHLLDVPLLLSYKFPGKFPMVADFGSTIGYLLKSNAIVYNRSISGYVTDAAVFNKVMVSLDAGAAINLKQWTRYPVNLGYRFRYSLGSATKKEFGAQHLLNSTFYLDIPLKK